MENRAAVMHLGQGAIRDQRATGSLAPWVLAGAVAVMTLGATSLLAVQIIWFGLMSLAWLTVPTIVIRSRHSRNLHHACAIGMLAWVATMIGILVVQLAGPDQGAPILAHRGFGEHPVLWLAGAPWPGIEGSDHGLAMERIPFFMGIDAMLVNFSAWACLLALLLHRTPRSLANLPAIAILAAVTQLLASWQLILLFD